MEKTKPVKLFIDLKKSSAMVSNTTYKAVRSYKAFSDETAGREMFVRLEYLKDNHPDVYKDIMALDS